MCVSYSIYCATQMLFLCCIHRLVRFFRPPPGEPQIFFTPLSLLSVRMLSRFFALHSKVLYTSSMHHTVPSKNLPPDSTVKKFVVRKYILARTLQEAHAKESSFPPDDIFLDATWSPEQDQRESCFGEKKVTGFNLPLPSAKRSPTRAKSTTQRAKRSPTHRKVQKSRRVPSTARTKKTKRLR